MKAQTKSTITNSVTFKLVNEEAQELSKKLNTLIYVIYNGNGLYLSLNRYEYGVLSIWDRGQLIY